MLYYSAHERAVEQVRLLPDDHLALGPASPCGAHLPAIKGLVQYTLPRARRLDSLDLLRRRRFFALLPNRRSSMLRRVFCIPRSTVSYARMASTSAHEGFTKLGADIYLRERSIAEVPPTHPACIVLFSWMDAKPQHIAKYTDTYAKIYPQSTLLLVRAERNMFSKSMASQLATLTPASDWLRKSGLLVQRDNRILVHAMSNGGSIQLVNVARLIRSAEASAPRKLERNAPPRPAIMPAFPARAYVYDSTPGKGTLATFLRAFTAHIANASFLRKLPYYLAIVPYYALTKLWRLLRGRPDRIQRMRADLLDPSLLRQQSPRTFIYSREDQLIDYKDVEAHVAEARRLGSVEAIEFKRSAHVGHVRVDPERYWKTVQAAYESSH